MACFVTHNLYVLYFAIHTQESAAPKLYGILNIFVNCVIQGISFLEKILICKNTVFFCMFKKDGSVVEL